MFHSCPARTGGTHRQQKGERHCSEEVTDSHKTAGSNARTKLGSGAAARQSQTHTGLFAARAAVRDGYMGGLDWRGSEAVTDPRGTAGGHVRAKLGDWRCSEAVTGQRGTAGSKGSCEGRCASPVTPRPAGPTDSKAKQLQPPKHSAATVRTPHLQWRLAHRSVKAKARTKVGTAQEG